MTKTFIAASIDKSAVCELKLSIEGFKKMLKEKCIFRELRKNPAILVDKLRTVVDLRNKSIDEAIPDEDMGKSIVLADLTGHGIDFEVMLDPVVEDLINQALKLSNDYIKLLTK